MLGVPRCFTCRYFFRFSTRSPDGRCHKYPPTKLDDVMTRYPTVNEYNFCGEWQPRKTWHCWPKNMKLQSANELKFKGSGCLRIRTINLLVQYSADELLAMNGVGPKTVERVRAFLAERGLKLKFD